MRLRKVIDNHLVLERMSRKEFSREMGCSPSQMSRWLNGDGNIGALTLANLLRWLLEADRVPKP